jgi:hypothetical protein
VGVGYAEFISVSESPPPTRVALLVDYPVLLRAIRATDPDAVPRLPDIVLRARALGGIYVARAYGAWYDVDEATVAFSAGLDPVFVPPAGPGSVPTIGALTTDGIALLEQDVMDVLALSGDERLLPLIEAAHAKGVAVALIAHSCPSDGACLGLADVAEPAAAFARTQTRAERYRRSSTSVA